MNRKMFWLAIMMLAVLALSACSGLIPRSGDPEMNAATQQAAIEKAVAGTATTAAMQQEIERLQTQVAAGTDVPDTAVPTVPADTAVPSDTAVPTATATLPPTSTPEPTATMIPTQTAAPTNTPTAIIPTQTPIPLPTLIPTATPLPCNAAQFVKDVTIADGSILSANSNFTKIWQLKNVGSCTWTTSYDVVFSSGDQMSAPAVIDLPGSVAPGQVIDIPIAMIAPNADGSFRGNWKLRDGSGNVFGLGRTGAAFYVEIRVSKPSGSYPLDFVASMCQAEWTSGAGRLDCPSPDNDSRGFVLRVNNPTLETGYVDDEPALVTHPQMVNDGIIRGKYPSMRVESGHRFSAIIGCARSTSGCDVRFQLDYQIGGGSIQNMASWHEVYDEKFTTVDVDLSGLAGNDVRFILTVTANGASSKDRAQWLAPRISK